MPITINTNVQSITAQRALNKNTNSLGKTLQRLSTGFRINNASDDAAGFQISEELRTQIRGTAQADSNVQDGINLLNTTEGSLTSITESLQRVRELLIQGANDTLSSVQRSAITNEIQQQVRDISRVANTAEFNNRILLDGNAGNNSVKIQVGANRVSATNTLDLATAGTINPFGDSRATTLNLLGAGNAIRITAVNSISALRSLSTIDTAIQTINNRRAVIGALTNRLESVSANLLIANENFSASESRIRNADIAKETSQLSKFQVLQQAAAQVLGQANQLPQLALSLLRGQ